MPPRKNKSARSTTGQSEGQGDERVFHSRKERLFEGEQIRDRVPHASHAVWKPPRKHRDPIELLEISNRYRLPNLVPVRYGRMLRSPFTFLRGSAGLMAHDLATTPTTGIQVQACGDCHLMNFGLFATPERNLIFDINDFDETLPAPWEWDVKRLAISFAVAARDNRLSDKDARAIAVESVRAYRERLRKFSKMSPLDVWYDRLDAQAIIDMAPNAEIKKFREQVVAKARMRVGDYLYPKISSEVGGRRRLIDQPPILFHVYEKGFMHNVRLAIQDYRLSLPHERRVLFDRYRLEDIAVKAVGIGSVGTYCFVGLFFSAENHPLLLQFKEACPSVLAPLCGQERIREPGPTGRHGAAPDAVVQRYLPGLDPRSERSLFLCPSVARHENVSAYREHIRRTNEDVRRMVRPHPGPCPRQIRGCSPHQRLPGQDGLLRPGHRQVCHHLRRSKCQRPRHAGWPQKNQDGLMC